MCGNGCGARLVRNGCGARLVRALLGVTLVSFAASNIRPDALRAGWGAVWAHLHHLLAQDLRGHGLTTGSVVHAEVAGHVGASRAGVGALEEYRFASRHGAVEGNYCFFFQKQI